MQLLSLLLLATSSLQFAAAWGEHSGTQAEDRFVPGAFIIQLEAPSRLLKRGIEPRQVSHRCCCCAATGNRVLIYSRPSPAAGDQQCPETREDEATFGQRQAATGCDPRGFQWHGHQL